MIRHAGTTRSGACRATKVGFAVAFVALPCACAALKNDRVVEDRSGPCDHPVTTTIANRPRGYPSRYIVRQRQNELMRAQASTHPEADGVWTLGSITHAMATRGGASRERPGASALPQTRCPRPTSRVLTHPPGPGRARRGVRARSEPRRGARICILSHRCGAAHHIRIRRPTHCDPRNPHPYPHRRPRRAADDPPRGDPGDPDDTDPDDPGPITRPPGAGWVRLGPMACSFLSGAHPLAAPVMDVQNTARCARPRARV